MKTRNNRAHTSLITLALSLVAPAAWCAEDAGEPAESTTPDESAVVETDDAETQANTDPAASAEAVEETPEAADATETTPPEMTPASAELGTPPPVNDQGVTDDEPEKKKKSDVRLEIGGRLGYALPAGDALTNDPLDETISATIPLQLDVWLRLAKSAAFGAYVQFAPGLTGPALEDCDSCFVGNFRAGVQYANHFNAGGWVDPWIGLGVGIEFATMSSSGTATGITSDGDVVEFDVTSRSTLRSFPEVLLQAGIDVGNDTLAFGPYVSAHAASYTKQDSELECNELLCPPGLEFEASGDVPDDRPAFHYWLAFGLRGTYLP